MKEGLPKPQIPQNKTLENKEVEKAPEGWMTNSRLRHELGVADNTVKDIANKYLKTNPEYFGKYKPKTGSPCVHYSPELVQIIIEELNSVEKAPKGWMTNGGLADELGTAEKTVKNIANRYLATNPEYFREFKDKVGRLAIHYSPELVQIIIEELNSVEKAPKGWMTCKAISKNLSCDQNTPLKIANQYSKTNPEYFREFKHKSGQPRVHYSPELVQIISKELSERKEAPEGWMTRYAIGEKLNTSSNPVSSIADQYRISNPEYFGMFKDQKGQLVPHYSPELVDLISKKFTEFEHAPEGWMTRSSIYANLKIGQNTSLRIADQYRISNPEYFGMFKDNMGKKREHYSPELVALIIKNIKERKEAPEGWMTNNRLSEICGLAKTTTQNIAQKYLLTNPEYFGNFKDKTKKVSQHYSPELVEIIKQELFGLIEAKNLKNHQEKLESDFENLVEGIASESNIDDTIKKIREILILLPGNAHDIILKYHPEFKGLKPDYVKQVIADYLGDFMLSSNEWQPGDIKKIKEVLDIEGIKEEILINLKSHSLSFINTEKKNNPDANEYDLILIYFNKEEISSLTSSGIPEVNTALDELRQYYENIFTLKSKKPDNIVEILRNGRTFPDINQLVNIQEIHHNKKMLIADDMGLGKSASAILSKEYLGLKCALIVVPSNVEDTWKGYLSDKVSENGKQIGYFKNGLAPKVLIIESPKDLERIGTEVFDYIVISQEKISGNQYREAFEKVDFDMMIVDEVHKLKNLESGVRSKAVEELAGKIQGDNKYLVLLSGTPIPNKVKDIAISLKLLYREKYQEFDSKEMVKRILYGDLIDLRSELLKRMQMKELISSIEMPELTELDVPVELAPAEREIYEILLEEDELTALDKIVLFRQFLLNPEILKVEPGFIGSKIKKLSETLNEDLNKQDKIMVFVNGYVEGVIRGENNIISKLNLPSDVVIEEIHGEISKEERKRIEIELKSSNQKMVIFVSGQTADVGVDYSAAEGLILYNDPWSNYDKKQQIARVHREGHTKPLTVKTLIVGNSIEEGMRSYSNAKEKAIKKLLKGISNTEAEKKLLYNDSKLVASDVETNAELSKQYLSDWEKLMMHFGEGYESGEKRFRQELSITGKEYAKLYKKLGRLTYQGNNARVTATIIEKMAREKGQVLENLRILDIASGPEMLKEASTEKLRQSVLSMDINAEHFTESKEPEKTMSSSYLSIPSLDESADYINLGFAFHQTSPIKYHKKNYERLQVLAEMNRVLKPGGRCVITMLHNVKLANPDKFKELVGQLGFKIVPEYNGEAKGGESYKADFITLEKVNSIEEYKSDALKFASADNAKYITELGDKLGREYLSGLDINKTNKGSSRLRDQRRMVNKVTLGGKEVEVIFNENDKELFEREIQTIKDGEALRQKYGGIKDIPLEEIKRIGFERKLETPGYYLLYKIIKDGGAVIIRGDYKSKR